MRVTQQIIDYIARFKAPNPQEFSYEERLANGSLTRAELESHRESNLTLHKEHLKLLLEANVFVYATTGALVSFVITHTDIPHIRAVLWLPIILGLAFATLFFTVSFGFKVMDIDLQAIAVALRLNTSQTINALPIALWISALALIVMAAMLIIGYLYLPAPATAQHCGSFVPF